MNPLSADNPIRDRIFIANVDQYDNYHISKKLSETLIGSAVPKDDSEQMEEAEDELLQNKNGTRYKVFGSLSADSSIKPAFLEDVFKSEKRKDLYNQLITCDYIIYNIKDDASQIEEAMWMLERLHDNIENLPKQKIFILISSVLTWARSLLPDEDDPELPFADEDYVRRKAHPNFKAHLEAEKTTIYYGRTDKYKLLTYVVVTGITYGEEQNLLHPFFKKAWHNAPFLDVPGDGENVVPTIHINDLASALHTIMEMRPLKHYIIAKDESQNTLAELLKAISQSLSTGKLRSVDREEAFLDPEFTQNQLDQLLVNLRMEASFLKEHGRFRWHCENGMVEEMANITKEYKLARRLVPIRLCILGPPASGKTTLAKRLSEYYKIQHIHIKGVLEETMANLQQAADALAANEGKELQPPSSPTSTNFNEDETELTSGAELLEELKQNMKENNGRLDVKNVTRIFRDKLNSRPCQNQGFVIDGYPKTRQQAVALFSGTLDEEADEEAEEEKEEMDEDKDVVSETNVEASAMENFAQEYLNTDFDLVDVRGEPVRLPTQPVPSQLPKGLLPAYIFELEAPDEFLRERVITMPEHKVQGTHNTELGLLRRLNEYRTNQLGVNPISLNALSIGGSDQSNEELEQKQLNPMAVASINEGSIRAYFDSKGVLQIPIDVTKDHSEDLEETFKKIVLFIGPPRNYGTTPEEKLEKEMKIAEEELQRQLAEKERIERQLEEEQRASEQRMAEWKAKHEALVQKEAELLAKESEPLRIYLKKHIMPVVAKGLTECVRLRPEDPIDFMAEYLFYHNPQVD